MPYSKYAIFCDRMASALLQHAPGHDLRSLRNCVQRIAPTIPKQVTDHRILRLAIDLDQVNFPGNTVAAARDVLKQVVEG